MCTLMVFHEPGRHWPVVLAANRDERLDRPALPFDRHWPDRPWRAGVDVLAGGTWAGIHDREFGVFMLDQERSLGPAAEKRSRGLLTLDLLEAGSPEHARRHLEKVDPDSYRPFHAVIASASGVIGVRGGGPGEGRGRPAGPGIEVDEKGHGIWVWTAEGVNRDDAPRQRAHRGAIEAVGALWRESADRARDPDWFLDRLEALMARPAPDGAPPSDGLCIRWPERGFGTRSSILVAFGSDEIRVRVADGPPDASVFREPR